MDGGDGAPPRIYGERVKGRLRIALGYLESGLMDAARDALVELLPQAQGDGDADALRLIGDLLTELGDQLVADGQGASAEDAYRAALDASPTAARTWNNLGLLLAGSNRIGQAIDAYHAALMHGGEHPDVLVNLGAARDLQGQADAAQNAYRRALAQNPQHRAAQDNLLYALHYTEADPRRLIARHRAWGQTVEYGFGTAVRQVRGAGPLRVGLVSPDLRVHSVSCFLEPLLESLDPDRVQIFAYAEVERPDAVTRRLQGRCAGWISTIGATDAQVADRVQADGIDVLVDLAGHTRGNRLGVFARRAAPVQVTWLGYPGTTGLPAMDARLVDAVTDPPGAEDWATEALVRLPNPFLCYGPPPDASAHGAVRQGPPVFGSFNNLAKLSPETVTLWAQVLAAVPDARLLLKARSLGDESVRGDVARRFAAHGIDGGRLDLRGWVADRGGHMALYDQIDVALDPTPYAGTTTTCEALWMGVPVITLAGAAHAARVGASLLTAVGGQAVTWIADNHDDYVATAVRMISDRAGLAAFRQDLRGQVAASVLCDKALFATAWMAAIERLAGR